MDVCLCGELITRPRESYHVSNNIKKPKKEGQVLHGPLKATDDDDAIV